MAQGAIHVVGLSKCDEHINNLNAWAPSEAVWRAVEGMGLEFLVPREGVPGFMFKVQHSSKLLDVIIRHYVPTNGTFVFSENIRLVYSLQDVFYLTGLPISGIPVVGHEGGDGTTIFRDAFGFEPDCNMVSGTKVKLAWLRRYFQTRGVEEGSPDFERHVRAYLLYYIGSYVLPDPIGVPIMYLSLLMDLSQIRSYAWGAAALAHLHVELRNLKAAPSSNISAQCFPLLLFFFEHIPDLLYRLIYGSRDRPVDGLDMPMQFPLIAEWTHLVHRKMTGHERHYEDILSHLTMEQVIWEPYRRLPPNFIPADYIEGGQFALSRTTLHCFEKCVYHRPDLSPRQFGFVSCDESQLRPLIELRTVSRQGPNNKDFRTYCNPKRNVNYGQMLNEWVHRSESVLEPMPTRGRRAQRQGPSITQSVSINILTAGGTQNSQESERAVPSSVLQLIRSLFPHGEIHVEDANGLEIPLDSVSDQARASSGNTGAPDAEPRASDEGIFLSNLLHQIMPVISQAAGGDPGLVSEHRMPEGSSTRAESSNVETSSRQSDSETNPPSSKRQRME